MVTRTIYNIQQVSQVSYHGENMDGGPSGALSEAIKETGFACMAKHFPCWAGKAKLQLSNTLEVPISKDFSKQRIVGSPYF